MPREDVLQQRPFDLRLIGADEMAGIEEQEQNTFLCGVDQLAGIGQVLGTAGWCKPLSDAAAINLKRPSL